MKPNNDANRTVNLNDSQITIDIGVGDVKGDNLNASSSNLIKKSQLSPQSPPPVPIDKATMDSIEEQRTNDQKDK